MLADWVKTERLKLTTSTLAGEQNDAGKSAKITYA
jgi:hypothetical protein